MALKKAKKKNYCEAHGRSQPVKCVKFELWCYIGIGLQKVGMAIGNSLGDLEFWLQDKKIKFLKKKYNEIKSNYEQ